MFSSSTSSNDDHIIAEPPNDAVSRLRFSYGVDNIFENFKHFYEKFNLLSKCKENVMTLEKPKWTIYLLGLMGK